MTLVVTDLAVVSVRNGRFVLEELAPGYSAEEVLALTGGQMDVSPQVREVMLRGGVSN